jgi:hypothetical protein
MPWTSPESYELFKIFVRHDHERRRKMREQLAAKVKTTQISEELMNELGTLSPDDFEGVMREHPGYLPHRKIESIETMLAVFRRAIADLTSAIADFPTYDPRIPPSQRERREADASIRVNKELLAATSASQALYDYCRRIMDYVDREEFHRKVSETFDDEEHKMIRALRDVLLHRIHTEASWSITYSSEGQSKRFHIDVKEILAEGELSAPAKRFLSRQDGTLDVTETLSRYAARVECFYGWLLPTLNRALPQSVGEYRRCRIHVKAQHARLTYRFLIGTWIQNGVDPYDHLPRHLDPEQLSVALALPLRSAEQIDYVISCLDRDGICDADLRKLIYQFFRAPQYIRIT